MAEPTSFAHGQSPIGAALLTSMRARSRHEPHRAATPLELFFDLVFAAAAALGAGLAVAVDAATHHSQVSTATAGAAVAIPVAAYLLCLWFLHDRPEYRQTRAYGPIASILVLLTPFTAQPVLLTGGILATLVSVKLALHRAPVAV